MLCCLVFGEGNGTEGILGCSTGSCTDNGSVAFSHGDITRSDQIFFVTHQI